MENSALQNPLETEGWLSVSPIIRIREQRCCGVDKFRQLTAEIVEVHLTGVEHLNGGGIVQQR